MIKFNVLFFLVFLSKISYLQIRIPVSEKYVDYFSNINLAKKFVINNSLDSALMTYDYILKKYNYPFYKNIKQAAILALYSEDTERLSFYLELAIKRGMNKTDFNYFVHSKKCTHTIQNISLKYDSLYKIYSNNIDYDLRYEFQALDAKDYFIHSYLYGYSRDSLKDAFHNQHQPKLIEDYINLIKNKGYPNEKKIGISTNAKYILGNIDTTEKGNLIYISSDSILRYNQTKTNFSIVNLYNPNFLIYSNYPGNWLLWHNAINREKDTIMQKIIIKGVMNLYLPPVFLTQMYENSHPDKIMHFDSVQDYATTYNSYTYRTKTKTPIGVCNKLIFDEKVRIDSLRKKVHILTIEDEEKLALSLYSLKTNRQINSLKTKYFKKIKFEYNSFISLVYL